MEAQINNYIDFEKLFLDLFEAQEEILIEEQYQAEHFKQILDFKNKAYNDFEIMTEECDYDSKKIVFWFTHNFNDANESCNQSTTADYVIIYDTILDEFTSCDYEQG